MTEFDEKRVYVIVDEAYLDTFEEKINEFLLQGYSPLGGVSTYVENVYDNQYIHYCQAMIKSSQNKS